MSRMTDMVKASAQRYYPALLPVALGGGLLGALGGGSAGMARMKTDPYADPKKDALMGAFGGSVGAATLYGISKVNPWLFLPVGMAGASALYMKHRERDVRRKLMENGPASYDFSKA